MKIAVLSPHRDDAAFSVGLSVGTWLNAGHEVEVLNCFTESEYSPFGRMAPATAAGRSSHVTAERHQEDVRWSRTYLRPVDLFDLHLIDAPQRLHCSVDAVCHVPVDPGDATIAKVRSALADRVTDALVLPLAIGDHVDHMTARIAAEAGWPSALPIAFYEDLPYAARPAAAAHIEARAESIGLPLKAAFVSEPVDVAQAVKRKLGLASCYESQIDHEGAAQVSEFCKRYKGRERLWVNRAWLDAGMGQAD